ncbi:vacuolar protein sorting-associated protein 4-like [Physella acuta]|uniref:vacuolar protein sorting-associated protein 4-like n=1 Tax=Physella acuta TaxID=109671 RepID=UPI0027DEA47F|nr:vacuolar protein sorting-associated protein 4-like [Physella acuta]
MMEICDLGKYTDAIACLQQTLSEGGKASNVDIHLMLSNIQRCEAIVKQLLLIEKDSFYSTALSSLLTSLTAQINILNKKIFQLNEVCHSVLKSQDTKTGCIQSLQNGANQDLNQKHDKDFDDQQSKHRQNVIESTISNAGKVGFDDVIGLEEAKCSLQDAVIMPLIYPHLFSGGRKPWKRILLFGPPGTGKTRLAQAVSTEVKATFYFVSSSDLMSSWVGESEKLIKELFHHASNQPRQSVIFIDEIDSLCRHRRSQEDEGTRRIKTELLIQMDGADRCQQDKIFLLCATNCPWDLDTAFLRRFQKRIYIPLPDVSSRIHLMKLHCKGNNVNLSDSDWAQLATQTDGYSGSDLSTLTNGALFQPIRDLQTANYWQQTKDGHWIPCEVHTKLAVKAKMIDLPPNKVCPRDVNLEDFLTSLKIHRPTVSKEELHKFSAFTSCYGQSG